MGSRAMVTMTPPKDPVRQAVAAMEIARPASPLRAMGYPSRHVAAFCAVPGVLSRMAGIAPPKPLELIIPANMNMAFMGSIPYEKGSAIAIERIPPSPGRIPNVAPIRVPIRSEVMPDGSSNLAAAKAILSSIVVSP